MRCPSCREDEAETVEVACLDEDGEQMRFSVCRNCDYGINEHTEGECSCTPKRTDLTQSERAAYQSLMARGVPEADAYEDALDGVDAEELRQTNYRATE